jgi:hypothetical protein
VIFHDNGNEENFFDRVDYHFSSKDSGQLNFQYTRSWFQTPNSYDSQFALPWSALDGGGAPIGPNGQIVGPADQRSQIGTFDVAPSWTHVINNYSVFHAGRFLPAGPIRLHAQPQSLFRSRPARFAAPIHRAKPHSHECRRSRRPFVGQRHQQRQDWRQLYADAPARNRHARHR